MFGFRSCALLLFALSFWACDENSNAPTDASVALTSTVDGKLCAKYKESVTAHTLNDCIEKKRRDIVHSEATWTKCNIDPAVFGACGKQQTGCLVPKHKCLMQCRLNCDVAHESHASVDALHDCREACSTSTSTCTGLGNDCANDFETCLARAIADLPNETASCVTSLQNARIGHLHNECQSTDPHLKMAAELFCGEILGLGPCVHAKGICSR